MGSGSLIDSVRECIFRTARDLGKNYKKIPLYRISFYRSSQIY
ncbi:hypothetical protein BN126_1956 [Cronobacter sakazakii 680]|nr:hypothetical protein BN129_2384 [Cronobacter sakazakii 701]CCK08280.1 hypothetical protein BN128_2299 [Cronobacter sakazakii 696]CCK11784.1 hypothetical protein BN126_1956 [Cronobacter sakazakii 680]